MTEVRVYRIRSEQMARYVKNILSRQGFSVQQVDNERFTTSANSEEVEAAIQLARLARTAENMNDPEFQRLLDEFDGLIRRRSKTAKHSSPQQIGKFDKGPKNY